MNRDWAFPALHPRGETDFPIEAMAGTKGQGKVGAVIVAAGSSSRMNGVDKTFAPLLGRPLIAHTLDHFEGFAAVTELVLVLAAEAIAAGRSLVEQGGYVKVAQVCAGGRRRQDSVKAGLDALSTLQAQDWVIIHDGARPGLTGDMLARGLAAAGCSAGCAVAGVPVKDTIKMVSSNLTVTATPDRAGLWSAQTPQIFPYGLLREAHARFSGEATDDAAMVESLGYPALMFPGSYENLKVTTPEDLMIMETLLKARSQPLRNPPKGYF